MDLDSKTSDNASIDQKDQTISVPGEPEVTNKPINVVDKLDEKEVEQKTKENREQALTFYKHMWMKRHNMEGDNIEEEAKKVLNKTSDLSRSQRDAVLAFMEIFPAMQRQFERQNEIEDLPVGTPLTKEEADAVIAEANKEADKSAE